MAQMPTDQNFFHHHPHSHHPLGGHHPHAQQHPPGHPQLQLPPQFRNPFDLVRLLQAFLFQLLISLLPQQLFEERNGAINYNYMRPYLPNQLTKSDELNDSLVMRRPRRTRTTFTSAQIAELELNFLQSRYLTASDLAELSAKLALGTAQVKIWFKNRRRRQKIQADQQKEYLSTSFTCDNGMSVSPSLPSLSNQELGGGGPPPNLCRTSPTTLTPSPTPSVAAAASIIDPYGESFNPSAYYYNNSMHCIRSHAPARLVAPPPPSQRHQVSQPQVRMHTQQYPRATRPSTAAAATAQFFPSSPAALQHQQQHHHQLQQQAQSASYYHDQQRRYHNYQAQKTAQGGALIGGGGISAGRVFKVEPDYNFNSPYYLRMSDTVTAGVPAATAAHASNAVDGPASAIPPLSDIYEPLTPKLEERQCLENAGVNGGSGLGSGSSTNSSSSSIAGSTNSLGVADDMDEANDTKMLQVLRPMRNNVATDDACGNGNGMQGITGTLNNINMADCSGAFAKYSKLAAMASESHEPPTTNYQCTMDTIMHAYNTHRTTASSTQFAYCFN